MKKNLHLFTSSFPFNNALESNFILPELLYTSQKFEHVYIYSLNQKGNITFQLPENTTIIEIKERKISLGVIKKIDLFYKTLLNSIKNKEHRSFYYLKYFYSFLKKKQALGHNLLPIFSKTLKEEDLLYTYWFDEWNYALSLLKKSRKVKNILISRTHGFDLYNERHETGKIPFRDIQLANTNQIFSISNTGVNYLSQRYPKFRSKFSFSRLGTLKVDCIKKQEKDKTLLLVSCSSIVPVKQVHLIPKILANVTIPIKWVHFGDGSGKLEIKNAIKSLPKNVTTELKGKVENKNVLSYYKENHVDLFINVSKSEGIPVSMMEAISFGIPLLGFNVGAISEIINKKTGKLLDEKIDLNLISSFINDFKNSELYLDNYRLSVLNYWTKNYSAEHNHKKFSEIIYDI